MPQPHAEISSDASRMDVGMIHEFLAQTYWAKGRTLEEVRTSIFHSRPYGVFVDTKQVAFARVVSDRVAFAYLLDVFVLTDYQSRGYATQLLKHILADNDLAAVRVWQLKTIDAQGLYGKLGFSSVDDPSTIMRWVRGAKTDTRDGELA